ncbi:hypothetical protein NIES2130_06180 [Scytonema sp. HK-05]|nr:hypothetical protein NIES2130_06180 [Scytonema sp. HK-05]
MSDSEQLVIYQLHIFILGISPMIWRRVKIRSDSTIADLHYMIQTVRAQQCCALIANLVYLPENSCKQQRRVYPRKLIPATATAPPSALAASEVNAVPNSHQAAPATAFLASIPCFFACS